MRWPRSSRWPASPSARRWRCWWPTGWCRAGPAWAPGRAARQPRPLPPAPARGAEGAADRADGEHRQHGPAHRRARAGLRPGRRAAGGGRGAGDRAGRAGDQEPAGAQHRGRPLSYITTYVPLAVAAFTREDLERQPLLMLLESAGVEFGGATQTISARLADAQVAPHLDVAVGSALLAVTRLVRDVRNVPCSCCRPVPARSLPISVATLARRRHRRQGLGQRRAVGPIPLIPLRRFAMNTRRHFLTRSAAAAALLSAPWIARGQSASAVKIGVLHPVTGALAYSGQQCRLARCWRSRTSTRPVASSRWAARRWRRCWATRNRVPRRARPRSRKWRRPACPPWSAPTPRRSAWRPRRLPRATGCPMWSTWAWPTRSSSAG